MPAICFFGGTEAEKLWPLARPNRKSTRAAESAFLISGQIQIRRPYGTAALKKCRKTSSPGHRKNAPACTLRA